MNNQRKGFTLIELLIVLALIAILAGIIIVVVRPAEIFKRGRDTKRIGDLRNIAAAIDNFALEMANNPTAFNWPQRGSCIGGSATGNVFFSIVTTSFHSSWPNVATLTPTGTTNNTVGGSGWVPLNLGGVSSNNLGSLPLDPINSVVSNVLYAYAFSCHVDIGRYELAAKLESTSTMVEGGNRDDCGTVASSSCLYEIGDRSLY